MMRWIMSAPKAQTPERLCNLRKGWSDKGILGQRILAGLAAGRGEETAVMIDASPESSPDSDQYGREKRGRSQCRAVARWA